VLFRSPTGLRLVESEAKEFMPWAWGINGCASVLGSVLEREPLTNPRYAWSLTEPLRCLETVMGNGDLFRTGELAGASMSTSTGGAAKLVPKKLWSKRKRLKYILYLIR